MVEKKTPLVIVAFTTKEKRLTSKKARVGNRQRANSQSSSEHFSVRKRIILTFVLCVCIELWRVEIHTTSYALLSVNMMRTSHFEYEYRFHVIQRSMSMIRFYSSFCIPTHCWSLLQTISFHNNLIILLNMLLFLLLFCKDMP